MLIAFVDKHVRLRPWNTPSNRKGPRRGSRHTLDGDIAEVLEPGDRVSGAGSPRGSAGEGTPPLLLSEEASTMTDHDSLSGIVDDDEFDALNAHRKQRDAELRRMPVLAAAAMGVAWAGGACGLAASWLLLLVAVVITWWRSRVSGLLDSAARLEGARVQRRRALLSDETAEWLNFLINRWWIFSSPTLFTMLKEKLEPLLNESKPAIVESLELRQLSVGGQTPQLSQVRAGELVQGKPVPLTLRSFNPPVGLAMSPRHQLTLAADVTLAPGDDFRCVLRTRLFGKGMGMDLDLVIEKLNITGRIVATITLDMDAPFPYITHLSFTFLEKPQVWFSVRLLKSVQAMEVPVLKTWIHSLVMDALVSSMVNPGRIDLTLSLPDCPSAGRDTTDTPAQGVLTITLSVSTNQSGVSTDECRWLVASIGKQRRVTSFLSPSWSESVSFLVQSLQSDRLIIKVKSKRLVSSITIAQYELSLVSYNLDTIQVVETILERRSVRPNTSTNIPGIQLRLEYSALPPLRLDGPEPTWTRSEVQGGVLLVVVHSAEGLTGSEHNDCNPYCMIFNNRKKVRTTHYLRGTTNPQWESRTQILVSDVTSVALSFVICSWNTNKMSDTDLLGLAVLSLNQGERWSIRRQLALTGSNSAASIIVSVVFQPVASVCSASHSDFADEKDKDKERERERPASPEASLDGDDLSSFNRAKRNSNTWMQQAKMLLSHKEPDCVSDISNLLSNGHGLIEIGLLRARDLVSKDLNGFSDPYCEVKVNGDCKYKSSIKKKTLNPTWEESTITGMPRQGETLDIMLWDHDVFGMKDFLGSVTFALDDIRRYSALDAPQWFQLHGAKTGSVELKIKVISDIDSDGSSLAPGGGNSCTGSPRLSSIRSDHSDGIIRRPSMDRSRLRLHVDHNNPPPPPPRTVTLKKTSRRATIVKTSSSVFLTTTEPFGGCLLYRCGEPTSTPYVRDSTTSLTNGTNGNADSGDYDGGSIGGTISNGWSPAQSCNSSPRSIPRVTISRHNGTPVKPPRVPTEVAIPTVPTITRDPLDVVTDVDSVSSGLHDMDNGSHFNKTPQYSSFRVMKQKVKQGLRLRRFRSEMNVHDDKSNGHGHSVSVSMEPRGGGEADATDLLMLSTEGLSHAVSQPNINTTKQKRPTELKGLVSPRPDTYVGVEGRVLQAQGLHVARIAQLYCRVKLQAVCSPDKAPRSAATASAGKTVAKSRLLPAVPNPRFELPFQLDSPAPIPRQAALVFEIRSAGKEVVAARRTTLQDLLSATAPDTNEVHTWLALNNGASLEVQIAHGRELKKPARRIFRSWSVHRIGKI